MRRANRLVADVLAELAGMVEPGVTTADLDAAAERLVLAAGAAPAFKGYRGYPATLCASVNDEVVHGIPAKRALAEGDIISLDMGGEARRVSTATRRVTVPVGQVSEDVQRLLRVTQGVVAERHRPGASGAAACRTSGMRFRSMSRRAGFSVVRELCRSRHRRRAARGAADRQLRRARTRSATGRGYGARHRADGEYGCARREGACVTGGPR